MGTNRVIITCYCQLLAAESLNVWLLRILWHVCIQLDYHSLTETPHVSGLADLAS